MSFDTEMAKHRSSTRKRKKRGRKKVEKVMHEFKKGTLRSSSGQKVTNRKQAIAIAMSEAGMSRKS
jgi:hypothetical protein